MMPRAFDLYEVTLKANKKESKSDAKCAHLFYPWIKERFIVR